MSLVTKEGMVVGPNRTLDYIVGNSFTKTYEFPMAVGYIMAVSVTAAREVNGNAMRAINLLVTLWNDGTTPAIAVTNDASSVASGNNITFTFASDPNDRTKFIVTVANADTGTLVITSQPVASILQ